MESESKKLPVLEGKDITLRLMNEEDTDYIVKWRNSDFVRRNFIYQKPFSKEGHQHWIKTMVDTGKVVQFIICTKEGRPIGSVYLRDINQVDHKAEYGIFIGEKDALGKGYGTQAARLMITYAFEQMGLHKLMLRLLADNKRALRSYEKAGFVQEGYLKDEVYLEGGYKDVIYMAVIHQNSQKSEETTCVLEK